MQQASAKEEQRALRHRWAPYLIAIFLYGCIAILFTYPQITILSKGFVISPVGASSDYNIVMWDAWWVKKALIDLKTNPFQTRYLFYPEGASLALHELTLLNSMITIPFQLLLKKPAGIILGSNIAILLTFVIAAIGMFALVKYFVKDSAVAFFGGLAFAFCPYRTMHIVHTDLLSMGWIPLYMLFLFKTLKERRLRNSILGALFFAAAMMTCNVYTYFLILLSGYFLVYAVLFERRELLDRRVMKQFALLFGLMALLLLPRLAAILQSHAAVQQPEQTLDMLSANLVGFVMPADKHIFYRFLYGLLPNFSYYITGVPGHATFLTYTVLGLAAVALVTVPFRSLWLWVGLFLSFFVLALGPTLHFWKWSTSVPLPYLLLYKWMPFFSVMRTPYRFIVPAEMGLILIACFGLKHLVQVLPEKAKHRAVEISLMRYAISAIFSLLLLIELWNVPFNTHFPPVPEFYQDLAKESGEFGVLDLPNQTYSELTTYMYFQTLHEKPIPAAVLSRVDPALKESWRELTRDMEPSQVSQAQLDRLRKSGIKYVIYHGPDPAKGDILMVLKLF